MKSKICLVLVASVMALTGCSTNPLQSEDMAPAITQVRVTDASVTPKIEDTLLIADVQDDLGIAKVEFYIGSMKMGEVEAKGAKHGSYQVVVGARGYSCLTARVVAIDSGGNRAEQSSSTRCI